MFKLSRIFFFVPLLFFVACSSTKNLSKKTKLSSINVAEKYAEIMDVPLRKINNKRLYSFINEWEGTRYRLGGTSKNGIDCSGFTQKLYKEVYGDDIPRNTSQQVKVIKRKFEARLKEGDLVFFNFDGKKYSHVGVFLQNGYFVHASTTRGVIVQKLKDPYIYKYFARGGSIK